MVNSAGAVGLYKFKDHQPRTIGETSTRCELSLSYTLIVNGIYKACWSVIHGCFLDYVYGNMYGKPGAVKIKRLILKRIFYSES